MGDIATKRTARRKNSTFFNFLDFWDGQMAVIIKVKVFFLTELHSRFKMSDVSMMIRKQEKKLTEVLMKKTHFSFGEIGTAPHFSTNGRLRCKHGWSFRTRGLKGQCYEFFCFGFFFQKSSSPKPLKITLRSF
jgi:hypothetical protein